MKVIVQRVKKGKVKVDDETVGKIDKGLVLLVGFKTSDTLKEVDLMVKKVLNLRIFDDEDGIMNKSVLDINGEILSVSQFTLYADTKKGNRPSYINSMKSDDANELYDKFNEKLKKSINVETGVFGADMVVSIKNDGPVTIILEN